MSLNFFKTEKTTKTDVSLEYSSVLNNLKRECNKVNSTKANLNIEEFIQKENINLRDQDLYKKPQDNQVSLKQLLPKEQQEYTKETARVYVNTLIQTAKTMPEIKSIAIECTDKVERSSLQNSKTISAIRSLELI